MAQELLTALSGAYDRPIDNPYGIGASALAQSMPMLVNPYGSVGGNFAAVAGAGLLSGLLGYFARQDAQETNARIAGLQSQFLSPTATEAQRTAIIAQEPRLSALQNALMAQKLNLQQIKAEEEQKALGKAAGEIAVIKARTPMEQQTAEAKAINDALSAGQATYASPMTGEVKEVPGGAGIPKVLQGIPKNLQDTAIKELETQKNLAQSIDYIKQQFKEAESLVGAKGMVPNIAGGTRDALIGKRDAIVYQIDKANNREQNSDVRKRISNLAPQLYDSPADLQKKAKDMIDLVSGLSKSTPVLDMYGKTAAAAVPEITKTAPQIPAGYESIGVNPQTGKIMIRKVG